MIHDYSNKNYFKRLPFYLAIFILSLIPLRMITGPDFNPDDFTLSEFLTAQAAPKSGRWMAYLSDHGHTFFGRVEQISTDSEGNRVVWLRFKDRGTWCPYSTGIWVDYNQLLLVIKRRARAEKVPEGSRNLIQLI